MLKYRIFCGKPPPPKFTSNARVHRSSCRGGVKDKNFYGNPPKVLQRGGSSAKSAKGINNSRGGGQGNGSSVKISEVINNGWLSR